MGLCCLLIGEDRRRLRQKTHEPFRVNWSGCQSHGMWKNEKIECARAIGFIASSTAA